MSFANTYFSRFQAFDSLIIEQPIDTVGIIVVIPCYSEPEILLTLDSLMLCAKPTCSVEVLVVVNYSESVDSEVKDYNNNTFEEVKKYSQIHSRTDFVIHPILVSNLPKKHAGVGFARKIGMDEAIHRYNYLQNPQGIIVAFDADSQVDANYLIEIEKYFTANSSCTIANIHYEHPLSGELPQLQYNAIAQYELHLRYYVEALTKIGFPYNYHTVGSSFALRASAYCRQGGMNKRQAGEDFYFLQKLFQSEVVGLITSTKVIPSSRVSQRVPFGTGYAMHTLMNSQQNIYYTYQPKAFEYLADFFKEIPELRIANTFNIELIYINLHNSIQQFIQYADFLEKIKEIQKNSNSEAMFKKRFFLWFNGFQVFKYMNFVHQTMLPKISIQQAAQEFLSIENKSVFEMLDILRHTQRGSK